MLQNAALLDSLGLTRGTGTGTGTNAGQLAGLVYDPIQDTRQEGQEQKTYGYGLFSPPAKAPAKALQEAYREGALIDGGRTRGGKVDIETGTPGSPTSPIGSPSKHLSSSRRKRTTRMRVMDMLGLSGGAKTHTETTDGGVADAGEYGSATSSAANTVSTRASADKYALGIGRGMNAIDVSQELYKPPQERWEQDAERGRKNLFNPGAPIDNIKLAGEERKPWLFLPPLEPFL